MKMKSVVLMLLAVLLALPCLAQAEESAADTLTMAEVTEWTERYRERALASKPLNTPKESLTSDGYEFIYEFATIYAEKATLKADTVINAVVITSPEEEGPRGVSVDDTMQVVLSAFYNENPDLLGTRDGAVLYMIDLLPDTLQWGEVQRDGQRVETIQYAVHEQLTTGGDGYTDAGVIFTMQDGTVSAIRVYGSDSRIGMDEVYGMRTIMQGAALETGYQQVPFSYDGAALEKFHGGDLVFSGIDFAALPPEAMMTLLGDPIGDEWMEDGDNGFIRMMSFPSCEITFQYDMNKENPAVYMLMLVTDGIEGPRAVRIGDTFPQVFNRFRNGEGEFDGVSRETLYGDETTGEFGTAEYGMDASATLRYGLVLEDGRHVVLHMTFTDMVLSEVMLYMEP